MDVEELFNRLPFVRDLGVQITAVGDGYAAGELELQERHASNPAGMVAHGGVPYSLADTVGGAAVMSVTEAPSPTVDMRIDYLAPATGDLHARGEVLRIGDDVATAAVTVRKADGDHVAEAVGTYKASGADGTSPWEDAGAFSVVEDFDGSPP